MKLNKKKGIILASSVISLILIGVLFVIYETGPYDKNNGQDIVVDIPMGSTISNIADILKENNLIKNKFIFEINFKLRNNYSNLKSGKYLLNQSLSNSDIINKLASGEMYQDGIKITIPEGSTSNEIISLLVKNELGEKSDYQKLVSSPSDFYDDFEFICFLFISDIFLLYEVDFVHGICPSCCDVLFDFVGGEHAYWMHPVQAAPRQSWR